MHFISLKNQFIGLRIMDSLLCFRCNLFNNNNEDSKTVSVCLYPEKRNQPGFVNISPTLVIDTSMESSSRVLQHGNTII